MPQVPIVVPKRLDRRTNLFAMQRVGRVAQWCTAAGSYRRQAQIVADPMIFGPRAVAGQHRTATTFDLPLGLPPSDLNQKLRPLLT